MQMLRYWLLAIRPKTLVVTLTPLLIGGALAYADSGVIHWSSWWVTLLAAMLIQIGTNLHNDVADCERGADTPARLGPKRATAERWLTGQSVRRAAYSCFALSLLLGSYLSWIGGWPIVVLGLVALAAGYAYTGGAWPIAYTPLGELFVLLFFGVAAVAGTYYLQTLSLSTRSLVVGGAIGLPAAAVLLINNYRDLESDGLAGRVTLVATVGRTASRYLYALMLLLPLLLLWMVNPGQRLFWLPWLALPLAVWLCYRLWGLPIDSRLNGLLALTAQYQLLVGLLFSATLLL